MASFSPSNIEKQPGQHTDHEKESCPPVATILSNPPGFFVFGKDLVLVIVSG